MSAGTLLISKHAGSDRFIVSGRPRARPAVVEHSLVPDGFSGLVAVARQTRALTAGGPPRSHDAICASRSPAE